eukprot:6484253-Amphidinium_carterae.1
MQHGLESRGRNRSHKVHKYRWKESAHYTEHDLVGGAALTVELEKSVNHTKLLLKRQRDLKERLLHKAGSAHGHCDVSPVRHKLSCNFEAIVPGGVAEDTTQQSEGRIWWFIDH